MIWWLAFEKKPFQFWREIWIQVVVILSQLYLQDDVFGLFITHSFTNSNSCCIRFDDLGRDFGSFIIIFYRESAILTCWKLLQIVLVKGRLNSIVAPTPFRYTPSSSRHGSKNKAIQEKWFAPYEYVALEFNSLNMCDKFELEFSKLSRARLGHFNFRAETKLTIPTICMSKNRKFLLLLTNYNQISQF